MKVKEKTIMSKIYFIMLLCVVAAVGYIAWIKFETENPVVELELPSYIGSSQALRISISDNKSGLRRIHASIFQNKININLYEIKPETKIHQHTVELTIEPDKINLANGKALFRLSVEDLSWWRWLHGNLTYIEQEVIIDTKPPEIQLLTTVHNIEQGGAGVAVYRVSESCESGVMVGDRFFTGYSGLFADEQVKTVFFALGYDQSSTTTLFLQATDPAGNTTMRSLPHHIRRKQFRQDRINISDRFLNNNMPEFFSDIPRTQEMPMLDYFIKINRDLRIKNEDKFREIAQKSEPMKHWQDEFIQLPFSANRAGFAEFRDYYYNGVLVDQQVHLGIDLASTAQAHIPAANSGKVIFKGHIGIYGNTVVIDHGFGLLTTYSHLSGYQVTEGQLVSKGQPIGNTGTTGLAVGDHLHFGVMVQHAFVNPLEWWDKNWIKNNVTDKISQVVASYPLKP